jgi:hypothetical protein
MKFAVTGHIDRCARRTRDDLPLMTVATNVLWVFDWEVKLSMVRFIGVETE